MKQTIARVIDRIHENHCLRAAMFAMGKSVSHGKQGAHGEDGRRPLSWRCRPGRMLNNMRFTPDLAKAPLATIGVRGSDQKRHGIRKPRRLSGGAVLPKHGSLGCSPLG